MGAGPFTGLQEGDELPDHEVVWRAVKADQLAPSEDGIRPQGAAFCDSSDDTGMSVDCASMRTSRGEGPKQTAEYAGGGFVVALTVAQLRAEGQVVRWRPEDGNQTHCAVEGAKNPKRRRRLAKLAKWVTGYRPTDADLPVPKTT
jgi:hypothetical protein